MEKKAIINAYDSYILAEKARESKQMRYAEEDDILEILRVLTESYRREAFTLAEILHVSRCLFLEHAQGEVYEIYGILNYAEDRGMVVSIHKDHIEDAQWKLTSSVE
jgi:hypothetical protein